MGNGASVRGVEAHTDSGSEVSVYSCSNYRRLCGDGWAASSATPKAGVLITAMPPTKERNLGVLAQLQYVFRRIRRRGTLFAEFGPPS